MTPERWQQIEGLFHSALERKADERLAFLNDACDGDGDLRQQVEALLASFEEAGDFIEQPPLAGAISSVVNESAEPAPTAADTSFIGRRIGHYQIISLLGAGGMGEVYLAKDLKLNRKIALKVLPEQFTADPERVRRFEREARAASALNHPNILTIHEIGQQDDTCYIATEYVDGITLRQRAAQDIIPLREALDIVLQIAAALQAAHEVGIVHRDIKPENIMLRPDGYVKVLDFGLAKLTEQSPSAGGAQTTAIAALKTEPGLLMGTLAYMSPEQVRGLEVDGRSDIFSLGVLLYEMVARRSPFVGVTTADVIVAILEREVAALAECAPEAPDKLQLIVGKSLRKNRDERYQFVKEILLDLKSIIREMEFKTKMASSTQPARGAELARAIAAPTIKSIHSRHTVGREKERAKLRAAFRSAVAERGAIVCVSGEPGLGKSTLVEDFLSELAANGQPSAVARGRCSERLAGTEAYLPFLEVLDHLLHTTGGESAARLMKQLAPTWYVQVARLPEESTASARPANDARAASLHQLKREMCAFLQEFSRLQPLLLFFDDLHWADLSTVDLLAYLATRFEAMRILIVAAYRPSDLLLAKHPFLQVKLDLQARGACREIALEFLTGEDTSKYLARRFPGHNFPAELPALIHSKTEGNPLFMTDLVTYLRDRMVIAQDEGRWTLARSLPDTERELPESVRSMIERKIAQLSEDDRRLLVAASVEGYEFNSAVVSKALSLDPAEVEERFEALEHVHAFVRLINEEEFPDHTLTLRYRFVHVLYQNAFYASLKPTRRAALSRGVAEALLGFYGEHKGRVASQFAALFEAGRDFARAAENYLFAARNAARVFANQEAVVLARRGLMLLDRLPDTAERAQQELNLQIALGPALMATRGYAAPEVEEAYTRAMELCRQMGETPELFRVMKGLWNTCLVRSELQAARELGEQLLAIAESRQESALLPRAHAELGQTLFHQGELISARMHLGEAIALYDRNPDVRPDPRVLSYASWTLWLLGYPDQALRKSLAALALSKKNSQPHDLAFALGFAAHLHQFRREVQLTEEYAEMEIELCNERGFPYWLSWGIMLRGWALTEKGKREEGIAQIREGLATYQNTGAEVGLAHFFALLIEAHEKVGLTEEGLAAVDEALDLMNRNNNRYYEAELRRLKGELLLKSKARQPEAEDCFRRAIEIARGQSARSLELRAAMSFSRLARQQGNRTEARQILEKIMGWFTEGFDTEDLKSARTLLGDLL